MKEEHKIQSLNCLVAFVQLKIRIYLETADKKLGDYEHIAANFGISAAEALRELKKVDDKLRSLEASQERVSGKQSPIKRPEPKQKRSRNMFLAGDEDEY